MSSFYHLHMSSRRAIVVNLAKSNLSVTPFTDHAFGLRPNNSFPKPRFPKLSAMSSEFFYDFTFKAEVHLEFCVRQEVLGKGSIFVYGCFIVAIAFVGKSVLPSLNSFCTFEKNQLGVFVRLCKMGYFIFLVVTVNGIAFLILIFASALLVYRYVSHFCMILYPMALFNYLVHSGILFSFTLQISWDFLQINMPYTNKDHFISHFSHCIPFIFFSCPFVLAGTSNIMLNKRSTSGHPFVVFS